MKKQLSIAISCLFLMAGLSFGQQSFSWAGGSGTPTGGTYATGSSFTLQLMGTFSGFNANGFSAWLETQSGLAPFLTVTNVTFAGATWTDPTDNPADYETGFSPFPRNFTTATGASPGFMRSIDGQGPGYVIFGDPTSGLLPPRTGDFGATGGPRAPGTYLLANISFQLAGNATPGTFTLQTTTIGGTASIFSDQQFNDRFVPAAGYAITVIPEPATIGLAVMGGVLLLGVAFRKRSNA